MNLKVSLTRKSNGSNVNYFSDRFYFFQVVVQHNFIKTGFMTGKFFTQSPFGLKFYLYLAWEKRFLGEKIFDKKVVLHLTVLFTGFKKWYVATSDIQVFCWESFSLNHHLA